jgi:hypothetical protein
MPEYRYPIVNVFAEQQRILVSGRVIELGRGVVGL